MKITLIDDDEELLYLMVEYLTQKGIESQAISDPKQALNSIQKYEPDLIFVDLKMGPPTGRELLELLATTKNLTPIVVMSGYLTHTLQLELKQLFGVNETLPKPFDWDEFDVMLNQYSSQT